MEYPGAELCFVWNFQGQSKKGKNPRVGDSKKCILNPRLDFLWSGIAQYTDDIMGNAPNSLGCNEQKESQL